MSRFGVRELSQEEQVLALVDNKTLYGALATVLIQNIAKPGAEIQKSILGQPI